MYVVTFYSFKGGVGRTLALVNVAAHLVSAGKKVLVVDFDLEAPGLDSFPSLQPKPEMPGIVEFVLEYLDTNTSPDIRQFVSTCEAPWIERGRLLLMRSGMRGRTYSARLSRIDWQRLYGEHDGYLLFEDLKAQWAKEFQPDYVLIDSRTGHTDVGGICTRQLPDAVVACFIPNEENVSGLANVVAEIQAEAQPPMRREIRIYFVPSNVPNLDDEKRILSRRIRQAKDLLHFSKPSCIIHRYESLSLLDNTIFVQERRHTRLAREYRELASVITQDNLQDRDAVLRLVRTDLLIRNNGQAPGLLDRKLEDIRACHSKDGEVLHEVAKFLRRLGRERDAQALITESSLLGYRSADTVLDLAYRDLSEGRRETALNQVREALQLSNADYFAVSRAVELCTKVDPSALVPLAESPSFRVLSRHSKVSLCQRFLITREAAGIAEKVLREIIGSEPDLFECTPLMLALIAQGKFDSAMGVIGRERPDPSQLGLVEAFNYAMAEWGATRRPPADLFARVLEAQDELSGKNLSQAFAIAAWATRDRALATRYWNKAFEMSTSDSASTFSAWRYLEVSGDQFQSDLCYVKQMIEGDEPLPAVFTENWT